jgi:hypothetical protein
MARRRRNEVPVDEWIKAGREATGNEPGGANGGPADGSPTEGAPTQPAANGAHGGDAGPAPAQPEPAGGGGADRPVGGAGPDVTGGAPEPAPDAANALKAYDDETLDLIDQAERLARETEREWDEKHTEASAAKKKFEKAVEDMRQLVRDRRDGRGKPKSAKLYPDPDHVEPDDEGEDGDLYDDADQHCDDSAAFPAVPAAAEGDGWKSVPLASLNIAKGVLKRLAEPVHKQTGKRTPITTLGELAAFNGFPDGPGWEVELLKLEGIGKGKADQVREAVGAFFAEQAEPAATA